VALGQLRAALAQHHGQVRKLGPRALQGVVQKELNGGVDHVVAAASHQGDTHGDVVHHAPQVVQRHAIRSHQHHVLQRLVVHPLLAEHQIPVAGGTTARHLESVHEGLVVGPVGTVAPPTRVAEARLGVALLQLGPGRIELLFGGVAAVGGATAHQLLRELMVDVQPVHLPVGAVLAPRLGSLVPLEAQPAQVAQDDLLVGVGTALAIGVFDAQDEAPAGLAGPQPVEERRAHSSDVQITRW